MDSDLEFDWLTADTQRLRRTVMNRKTAKDTSTTASDSNSPMHPLTSVQIMGNDERNQVIHRFNATEATYPKEALIHELFEQQAERTPEVVAVQYEGQCLTYAGLNARANQLAHGLLEHGAGRGQSVAIVAPRGIEMLLAQLATLKAGGTYVPVDPEFPQERRLFMLKDCRAKVVLSGDAAVEASDAAQTGQDVQWLDLGHALDEVASLPVDNPTVPKVECAEAAYVMYTSGSTGQPKGVAVPHRAISRLVISNGFAELTADDVVVHCSNTAFDASTLEVWGALLNGGRILVVSHDQVLDPERFGRIMREGGATVLYLSAGLFNQYADQLSEVFAQLKYLIVGGDVLDAHVIRWVLKKNAPRNLLNGYGPTETTTFAATCRLNDLIDESSQRIPLGRPIGNTQIYILDGQGQPVPVGVTGEIYIGGDGVALGYLNRPELTAERFIPDPFSDEPDARMYRSGDLGYWREDGLIEFMGRNDFQVKIRGFRIELGEIETRLGELPEVKEVVVLAREDHPGDKRLVAYWTPAQGQPKDELPRPEQLRDYLRESLPSYMVPSAFVKLEALPLTPNGKVDRKALPVPDVDALVTHEYEAPQGEVEQRMALLWQELLGVERVGRNDNFFDLGGNSLLMVALLARLRDEGLFASVEAGYPIGAPTMKDLAAQLVRRPNGEDARQAIGSGILEACTRILPEMVGLAGFGQAEIDAIVAKVPGGTSNIQDIYPLSTTQEGILFHHRLDEKRDAYVVHEVFRFDSVARFEAFFAALQELVRRHDALRTMFVWEDLPEPVQVVQRHAEPVCTRMMLDAGQDAAGEFRQWLQARFERLDLGRAPLVGMVLGEVAGKKECYGALTIHHIITDHVSIEVMLAEIGALMQGQDQPRPAQDGQAGSYRGFVEHSRDAGERAQAEAFFKGMLADYDEPALPFGLQDVRGDGTAIVQRISPVEQALARQVRRVARSLRISPAIVFHLVFGLVLGRFSGRNDVVFGTVMSGRMAPVAGIDRMLGMFINVLPLRLNMAGLTVRETLLQLEQSMAGLIRHESASLALAQRCSGVEGDAPLFSALFNYRHGAMHDSVRGMDGVEFSEEIEATNYPFGLSVDDTGDGFVFVSQTDPSVDAGQVIGYLHRALQRVACVLEREPTMLVDCLDIMPQREREQVIHGFNATEAEYPKEALIHELFEQQAERTPEAVAVRYEQEQLTYAQLNAKANQLAHRLRAMRDAAGAPIIKPDALVAISVERSLEMVVGLLGILKVGAAYVPVDPDYPAERIAYMLKDSQAKVLLTQKRLQEHLLAAVQALDGSGEGRDSVGSGIGEVLLLDEESTYAGQPEANIGRQETGQDSKNLAYVIYTSGSTGQPKGVMVEHRQQDNLLPAIHHAYGLTERDRVLQFVSMAFDVAAQEIFGTLTSGATLVLRNEACIGDSVSFWQACRAWGITVAHLPAAFWHRLAYEVPDELPAALRLIALGGERLDPGALSHWFERQGERVVLLNEYGPTEATVTATTHVVQPQEMARAPIGRPLANVRIYVLDDHNQPAPIGVQGEIFIGGEGVARGYLNRLELSGERFVKDPFSEEPGARMYRAGDLGYWQADGVLQFAGRNDDQVKIRGFRVELGEIEARLGEFPPVKEVVVLAREDHSGDKRLVAYWTAREELAEEALPDVERLRNYLKAELPAYMVPSAFVKLEAMPLTPNGKVDRKALPAPDAEALVTHMYEAPRGPVEEVLAGIWQELLGVERVGRNDSFFDLGGHSLLIVSMVEKLRQADLKAEIRQVFHAGSLAALAAEISGQEVDTWEAPANLIPQDCTHITPDMLPLVELDQAQIDRIAETVPGGMVNIQDIYPLAPLQEGVLFYHRFHRNNDPYVTTVIVSFDSQENFDRFAHAMNRVVERHDVLRTAILWDDLPRAVQVVHRHAELVTEPLEVAERGDVLQSIQSYLDQATLSMDLSRPPLLNLRPVRVTGRMEEEGGSCHAVLMLHHVIGDHVSLDVMMQEVVQILEGEEDALPVPVPYRGFVAHNLDRQRETDAEVFFRQMLGDVDEPTAPFGLTNVHGDGTAARESERLLGEALSRRIRECVRKLGMSAATLFHVAYALVLARCASRDDVVFGSVLSGRMGGVAGADRMMGMFINTLPVRFTLKGVGVLEAMRAAQGVLVDLLKYEQTPLAVAQRCSGLDNAATLFSAMLNFRHSQESVNMLDRSGMVVVEARERTNYPFAVSVDDLGYEFALTAQTDVSVVVPERILGYLGCAVLGIVEALEEEPGRGLKQLEVLPQFEREQLIDGFNATQAEYPKEALIHELFEQQVQRTPDAVSVQYEGERLTYAQLNAKANQLAHRLRQMRDETGAPIVGPDALVAISVQRSLEMMVGLLGILKAGAAYVPVDPEYPTDRIAYMLEDSQARVLLTQRGLLEHLSAPAQVAGGAGGGIEEIVLLDDESTYAGHSEGNISRRETGQTSSNLAYVIYTSGSTGLPKGVMIEHSGVCNLAQLLQKELRVDETSRVLQFASFSFDACVWEVVVSLLHGASLQLSTKERLMPGEPLRTLLQKRGITHAMLPPMALSALGEPGGLESLQTVSVGGDVCPPQLAQQWSRATRFVNAYGPTEATVCATMFRVAPDWAADAGQGLPIGAPVANARIYILDERQQPVPLGVAGELYVGGAGVARGYLNRRELTAERFMDDPFSDELNARMYRTGDLCRWRADGVLEYLGRNDFQVKIRGFRIELGEIEARLAELSGVRDAVVVAREDHPGSRQLVAYWTPREEVPETELPSVERLREHLRAELPAYMVPAAFVKLQEMPLTPNGKVDRKALLAPDAEALVTHVYEAPRGPVEEVLAGIWQELLGVERVGRNDSFFDLGGHSLLLTKLVSRLRDRMGMDISMSDIFSELQFDGMAMVLERKILEKLEQAGLYPGDAKD